MGVDWSKIDFSNLVFSKINRKLTILFFIVALVAPTLGIYYFYMLTTSSLPEALFGSQDPLLRTGAITIIVVIAVDAAIIGFFVSRSISRPIKLLYEATKEVEKGNYDVRLKVKTNDEIGMLAQAFNKTTAALSKLERERYEIDSAKTEFLSITSHELRSPMTPMKAQLQMLMEGYFGKLSKKQKDSLKIVIRNADRLDNIIVDFLEISRIEAARLKFEFRLVNLADTVKETVEFMQAYANEKNIQLLTKIDELPEIEADPDRISQVLRNLINNAIKFSENKSKIEINAKLLDEQIEFSVRDYGCGLSAENQIRVFEPFYQVESASQRRHGGTGLGLAICRGIVESQRGKIWVESKEGAGSKFTFTFPLKPVRKIEPIKVLFSKKGVIDRKIKEEFSSMLGPLGEGEFIELQSKNALGKDDILEYIDSLTKKYILSPEKGDEFKIKIGNIFGEEIEEISEKENKVYKKFKEEVLKRD